MPTITVQQLIDETRVLSGLNDNQYLDDDAILVLLNDAYKELDDTFTSSMQHWRRKEYDFTLAGGVDGNSLDLSTDVPDFQLTQGVDDLSDTNYPRPLRHLGSFTNRNGSGGWMVSGAKQYF